MTTTDRTPDLEAISQRLHQTADLVNQSATRLLEVGGQVKAVEALLVAMDQLHQVHQVLTTS